MANPGYYTDTQILGHHQYEWYAFPLLEGDEVIVELTIADPEVFDGYATDLDITIYTLTSWPDPVFYAWYPHGAWEDPHIAEHFGFEVPVTDTYYLQVYGWFVQEGGVEYTLTVEWGDLPDPTTARPTGVTRGNLMAFARSARAAKDHASWKSAIQQGGLSGGYFHSRINFFTVIHPDGYERPPTGTFCTEDHLAVGGLYMPAFVDPFGPWTPEEARYIVENNDIHIFLRLAEEDTWIPLSDLTKVTDGPPKPDHIDGMLWRYSRLLDVGFFRPGELAEKLGDTGLVEFRSETWWYGDAFYDYPEGPTKLSEFEGCFWLLPPP
jgi:hypothetical protein